MGPEDRRRWSLREANASSAGRRASAAYLTKAAAEAGALRTESGIVYLESAAGTRVSPTAADRVKVHYRGTLINGTEFDSSYARNEPAVFPLTGVIRCWTEGVQRMKVGGKARLVCPSDLAYGDRGNEAIPGRRGARVRDRAAGNRFCAAPGQLSSAFFAVAASRRRAGEPV